MCPFFNAFYFFYIWGRTTQLGAGPTIFYIFFFIFFLLFYILVVFVRRDTEDEM